MLLGTTTRPSTVTGTATATSRRTVMSIRTTTTTATLMATGQHPHRSLPEIHAHIDRSALTPAGKARAKALFQRLAEAEAAIHQMPVDRVHLHEVGALDSIIDIVGAVFALEWFKADAHRVLAAERRRRDGATRRTASFRCPRRRPSRCSATRRSTRGAARQELLTPDRRADR